MGMNDPYSGSGGGLQQMFPWLASAFTGGASAPLAGIYGAGQALGSLPEHAPELRPGRAELVRRHG